MPEPNPHFNDLSGQLASWLRRVLGQGLVVFMQWFDFLRVRTESTREQLKEVFYTTSDQVLERAEETRKSVKLRMAILEIEHHLNRLYPQIGKLACDLWAQREADWPGDSDLRAKVELADEYRRRLDTLRQELEEHQARSRAPRA